MPKEAKGILIFNERDCAELMCVMKDLIQGVRMDDRLSISSLSCSTERRGLL